MSIRPLLLVVFCMVMLSSTTSAQCKINLKIGVRMPTKCISNKDDTIKYRATAPSQLRPSIEQKIAGVKYAIAFDEETRKIKYIHTSDRAFRSANGLQVGSQIKVTQEQLTGGDGGWYTFAGQTTDGWDIIVGVPSLSGWKKDEVRTTTISGFKKGGN